jgi:hypothetical protein
MTATQYLNAPKLQIKKANWEKSVMKTAKEVLIKDFKAQHAPIKEQECHRLNHVIVTFLSREIADSLLVLSERRLISTKDIKYFEKLASGDNDYIENGYRKSGAIQRLGDDFILVVGVFNSLAAKSLSEFQVKSNPMLVEVLSLIYQIKHIKVVVPILCAVIGRLPQKNVIRILNEKISELQALFMKQYAEVSNAKTFDFDRFQKTFQRIAGMTTKEFTEYAKEISPNV